MRDLLQELTTLHPKMIDLSLDRMHLLLDRLGSPHIHLPPVVHVAGTNGKGSTIAFTRALLEAAGLRVHVYTSPHLVRFNERIVLAGDDQVPRGQISDILLRPLLEMARDACGDTPITFFEITTLAAFLAFRQYKADVLILETGMGGRLDATNVVPHPLMTAITPIGFDHMNFLGNTLEAIAGEKAGIMKSGTPCMIGFQSAASLVMPVFRHHAAAINAPLAVQGIDWQTWPDEEGMGFQDQDVRWLLPPPGLSGQHQIDNAGLALKLARRCCQALQQPFDLAQARLGLQSVDWPARLQRIAGTDLWPEWPDTWSCWLDGGHNEDGARILAAQARQWKDQDGLPLDVICGMLSTKQPENFFTPLMPFIDRLITVPIPDDPLGRNPVDLAEYGTASGLKAIAASSIKTAMSHLLPAPMPGPRRVLICGSLHLAGAVLTLTTK